MESLPDQSPAPRTGTVQRAVGTPGAGFSQSHVASVVFGPTRPSASNRWSPAEQDVASVRLSSRIAALTLTEIGKLADSLDSLIRYDLTGAAALRVCEALWARDAAIARAMPTVEHFVSAVTRAEGYNMMLQPEALRQLRDALAIEFGEMGGVT